MDDEPLPAEYAIAYLRDNGQAYGAKAVEALVAALREIADSPCLDPEGNRQIALAALQKKPVTD